MKNGLISLLFILIFHEACAQDYLRRHTTKVWISLNSKPIRYKGILYKVMDSSIKISPNSNFNPKDLITIYISQIEKIAYRKNYFIPGRILSTGLETGLPLMLIGFLVGNQVDKAQGISAPGTSPYWKLGVAIGAVLGVPPGIVIGAVAYNQRIHMKINGSLKNFNVKRHDLQQRAILH